MNQNDESSLVSSDSTVRSSSAEESSAPGRAHGFLPSSAATVPAMTKPTGAAVAGITLTPASLPESDTTGPRAATLKTVHPFAEVPTKAAKIFTIAQSVEYNITASHDQRRKAVADAPEKKAAHALLKRPPEPDEKRHEGTAIDSAYEMMKLGRKTPSLLEHFLADSPAFRPLLFAPSGGVRDTVTGLYAELVKVPGTGGAIEYVLCFPGTGCAGGMDAQWKTNASQLTGIGGVPKLYSQALALATELKAILQESNATLSVAGHSLGGGVANFLGLALDLDSYCFNAAALGPASLGHLDVKGCLTAERISRQVHVGIRDDWATHPTLMAGAKALARLADKSAHGLSARQVGQLYQLAPEDAHYPKKKNMFKRHELPAIGPALFQHTRNPRVSTSSTSSTPFANAAPTRAPTAAPATPKQSSENQPGSE